MTDAVVPIRERVRQAMSKPSIDDGQAAAGACTAHGCPCRGTVDLGSAGRFFCQWHAWVPSDRWGAVTEQLQQHCWLVDHIGEMQRLHYAGGKGAPWVIAATTFWRNEVDMQPQPIERANWNLYLWRLREELAHRIGVRKERPDVRTAQRELAGFLERARISAEADDAA